MPVLLWGRCATAEGSKVNLRASGSCEPGQVTSPHGCSHPKDGTTYLEFDGEDKRRVLIPGAASEARVFPMGGLPFPQPSQHPQPRRCKSPLGKQFARRVATALPALPLTAGTCTLALGPWNKGFQDSESCLKLICVPTSHNVAGYRAFCLKLQITQQP